MSQFTLHRKSFRWLYLGLPAAGGLLLLLAVQWLGGYDVDRAHADPIEPPEGYPKYIASVKSVTPTLVAIGGSTLYYRIEIVNTGAYTGFDTALSDTLPAELNYNDDAQASSVEQPTFDEGVLGWTGDVGFDDTVVISFSTSVTSSFSGEVKNTAVISHPRGRLSTHCA